MNHNDNKPSNLPIILWVIDSVLLLGLLVARLVYPQTMAITIAVCVALVGVTGYLIHLNRRALKSRTTAFGVNSIMTAVLVLAILGVVNFMAVRYPLKKDLTRDQVHTLSEQTRKIVKGLKQEVHAVYFAKVGQREDMRPLLENYSDLSPQFKVEYVDPDKEPTRARQAGVKKFGTLQLVVGTRDQKIEEVDEEKITNELIKLLKEKAKILCAVTGHGEKSFSSSEADGYETARNGLVDQFYEVRDLNLIQEGKVPADCDAIAIMGPNRGFFDAETKSLNAYLEGGGRALIALDTNLKGQEFAPEFNKLLATWYVRPVQALIVDPISRALGVDAAVPLLATFSKDSPITRDFKENCYFPFTRPLEILPNVPAGLTVTWLAQTTPKAWGEKSTQQISSGAVTFDRGSDIEGPLTVAIAVEGKQKDSEAKRNTRIVVFGTSAFATNNYSRFGGNLDLLLNSASWLLDDEGMIAIRPKEAGSTRLELTPAEGSFIFILTVFALPGLLAIAGIVVWFFRRRL